MLLPVFCNNSGSSQLIYWEGEHEGAIRMPAACSGEHCGCLFGSLKESHSACVYLCVLQARVQLCLPVCVYKHAVTWCYCTVKSLWKMWLHAAGRDTARLVFWLQWREAFLASHSNPCCCVSLFLFTVFCYLSPFLSLSIFLSLLLPFSIYTLSLCVVVCVDGWTWLILRG